MSEPKQFRTRAVMVSQSVYSALQVLADIEGATCPDEVADLRLGLLLSNEACIPWAVARRRKVLADFNAEYAERVKQAQAGDQLP